MKKQRILAIETSCDDTSVALIKGSKETIKVIKEVNASQINIHKEFGGVVPEVAARKHTEIIIPIIEKIYDKNRPPDAIAVTGGPGLITSLLVGVETAKTIGFATGIPLINVNHMEGHIYSNWLTNTPLFPVLCLIVSGGHTELIVMKEHLKYKKIGFTVDDAAGEAFDKVGKLIGLDYPGGPKISKLAENGNQKAINFPRPMLDSGDYQFSFAGLKTSALYYVREKQDLKNETNKKARADFCASFEKAIVDVLLKKTIKAAREYNVNTVLLGGGVAANKLLRHTLSHQIKNKTDAKFLAPDLKYCMDNAAMIGAAAYFKAQAGDYTKWNKVAADPEWEI